MTVSLFYHQNQRREASVVIEAGKRGQQARESAMINVCLSSTATSAANRIGASNRNASERSHMALYISHIRLNIRHGRFNERREIISYDTTRVPGRPVNALHAGGVIKHRAVAVCAGWLTAKASTAITAAW